jgi:conjugal transfer pilus assembly protein TraI
MTWNPLKNLRRRRSPESRTIVAHSTAPVPFALEDPKELLHRHRKRLTGIRLESGYNARDFHRFVHEPLWLCATYIHELPASRAENHREKGGLLRFCIETAHLAFRRADGKLFHDHDGTARAPQSGDTAWRYAAFLAGLCLPLGRAATAVHVSSLDGKLVWNPYACGLHEWATTHGLSEYQVDWRSNQDARSPANSSSWIAARYLRTDIIDRLHDQHPMVVETLIGVLNGRSEHTLAALVSESLVAVVDQDLATSGSTDSLPVTGIRAEHRVLDAIRGLIRDKWTCNSPGSRVWVTSEGVFINWKPAVNDLMVRIRANGSTGGLTDPDSIAELLIEHDILLVNQHPTSSKVLNHYHRIVIHAPQVPKHPMECVMVANPTMLGLQLGTVTPVDVEVVGRPAAQPEPEDPQQDLLATATHADRAETEETASSPPRPKSIPSDDRHEVATPPQAVATDSDSEEGATQDTDLSPLKRYGVAGEVLMALAASDRSTFVATDEGWALPYPNALQGICDNPAEFLTSCRTQSLLVPIPNARKPTVIRKRSKNDTALPEQYIVFVPRLAEPLGLSGAAA